MATTLEHVEFWNALLKASGKTKAEIAREARVDRSLISKLFSKPGQNPGVFTIMRIASALGVSHDFFMQPGDIISVQPPTDEGSLVHAEAAKVVENIMRLAQRQLEENHFSETLGTNKLAVILKWWHVNGGVLLGHESIQENFDIIEVPQEISKTVRPHRVGANSYAAKMLQSNDPKALENLVKGFSVADQTNLAKSYYDVASRGVPELSPYITAKIPKPLESGITDVEYFRLQLPVTAPNGTPFVLSYCFPL